jgi:hypothetical protein
MGQLYTVFTRIKALLGLKVDAGGADITGNSKVTGNLEVTGVLTNPGNAKLVKLGVLNFNSAASGTAVTLYTLPEGAILKRVICNLTAAFNAGDSNVVILGTAATADLLMAAGDINEATPAAYFKDKFLVGAEGGTAIKATYTQGGAAATTGAATFYGEIVGSMPA